MGGRHARTLIVLVAALARAALAQNPPAPSPTQPSPPDTTRRDSMMPRQIFNDIFPVGTSAYAPRITLEAGMVYRVELQPATAEVSIRSARRPSLPPLFMVPIGSGGFNAATETYAALVVPRSTEEYRFDVTNTGTEPVTLRVWTDPREQSRYARMRAATKGLPMAGLGVRFMYLGAFVRPAPESGLSPGSHLGSAAAWGVETCLGVVPLGGWVSGRWGGCVLAIGRLARPDSVSGLWFIGTEPQYTFSAANASVEQSIVLTMGVATPVSGSTDYLELAVGYKAATRLLGRHLYVEADASLCRIQHLAGGPETVGQASLVPRLAGGVELRF